MAKFNPQNFDINSINNGNRFEENDGVSAEAINAPIEAAALLQSLATNTPDISEIDTEGEPSVSIDFSSGNARFKFKHLKGKRGDSGLSYGASLSNEIGESDTDGYTKTTIHSLISNPNLLINGDFRVNQRGASQYTNDDTPHNTYTVDRWIHYLDCPYSLYQLSGGGITVVNSSTGDQRVDFAQIIENGIELLDGVTVTLSAKINGDIYFITETVSDVMLRSISIYNNDRVIGGLFLERTEKHYKVFFRVLPNETLTVSYVKLEIGSIATPFSPRPYAEELAMCQRYYYKTLNNSTNRNYPVLATGIVNNKSAYITVPLPQTLRTIPTFTYGGNMHLFGTGTSVKNPSLYLDQFQNNMLCLKTTFEASDGLSCLLRGDGDKNAYLAVDAEIY